MSPYWRNGLGSKQQAETTLNSIYHWIIYEKNHNKSLKPLKILQGWSEYDSTIGNKFHAHKWFNINDADLPSSQNVLHCVHAGAVEVTPELPILHKPEATNTSLCQYNFYSKIRSVCTVSANRYKYDKILSENIKDTGDIFKVSVWVYKWLENKNSIFSHD